jgi:hypothetical protein
MLEEIIKWLILLAMIFILFVIYVCIKINKDR